MFYIFWSLFDYNSLFIDNPIESCKITVIFFGSMLPLTSCQKREIGISCPLFASTLKCTLSPYISLIGHSKVDFSFQKFHWLFENNETDKGD